MLKGMWFVQNLLLYVFSTLSFFLGPTLTVTWPLPSSEGCRPLSATSTNFWRAYQLGAGRGA